LSLYWFEIGKKERIRKEKRVTPEFGERKEEKILPPNSGRYNKVAARPSILVSISKRNPMFMQLKVSSNSYT
jgi:hypothetical protein